MKNSRIAWCHHTFNPWWGCVGVSAACDYCYACACAKRWGFNVWGKDAPRRFFGEVHWAEPVWWNRDAQRRGVRERVFCGSMCDVMEDRPDLWHDREILHSLIRDTPNLDWLLLTKRPENFQRFLPALWHEEPPRNVWLLTTVESQAYVGRIEKLLEMPAVVHGVSIEPMLGPIFAHQVVRPELDWIILGGESGQRARPFDLDAARRILALCRVLEIPAFVKQLGTVWAKQHGSRDMKGSDPAEWPEDLRVREFPRVGPSNMSGGG